MCFLLNPELDDEIKRTEHTISVYWSNLFNIEIAYQNCRGKAEKKRVRREMERLKNEIDENSEHLNALYVQRRKDLTQLVVIVCIAIGVFIWHIFFPIF